MLKNLPPVTLNFLLLNILLFVVSLVLMQNGAPMDDLLGAHYFNSVLFEPYQVVSHMFMHSLTDPYHILFNMLLLVIFGGHLERLWGARRYFIFYIACGLGALVLYSSIGVYEIIQLKETLLELGVNLGSVDVAIQQYELTFGDSSADFLMILGEAVDENYLTPEVFEHWGEIRQYVLYNVSSLVGASGALFGVMAAFMIMFPNTELYMMFIPIPIKAKYLIGGYLAFEVYNSLNNPNDHIAHLAHVGGAIVGITLVLIRRKTDRKNFW